MEQATFKNSQLEEEKGLRSHSQPTSEFSSETGTDA